MRELNVEFNESGRWEGKKIKIKLGLGAAGWM